MAPESLVLDVAARENAVSRSPWRSLLHPNVILAAVGYLVDTYDLMLFSIVRRPSLEALGYSGDALLAKGVLLLNLQMIGMLVGGFFWGMLGDKRGRLTVLFGSIVIYSLANIANAWVDHLESYAALRFIAGFGLAGELGAAITLVSEVLSIEHRGYATTLVALCGGAGVILAVLVGELVSWQTAYLIGGVLGFLLLFLRVRAAESGLFNLLHSKADRIRRGDLALLFSGRVRWRFFKCVLAGGPLWFMSGILSTFAPEIGRSLGAQGELKVSMCLFTSTFGILAGDLLTSMFSHYLRSRRKVMVAAIALCSVFVVAYLFTSHGQPWAYYTLLFIIGTCTGYWAVLLATTAEQFGTNLRATVTTTVPNLIRALVIPMSIGLEVLSPEVGLRAAALVVGMIVYGLALLSAWTLPETFGRNLDFLET